MAKETTLPAAKEYAELQRRFKRGYTIRSTRGGHFRIFDRNNKIVRKRDSNAPFMLPSTPSRGVPKGLVHELNELGILKNSAPRPARKPTDEESKKRREAIRAKNLERSQRRQQQADELHERLTPLLEHVGGWDAEGVVPDLGQIGAWFVRTGAVEVANPQRTNPDLLRASADAVRNRHWVIDDRMRIWVHLAELLEAAGENVVDEFFRLVRLARGLPAEPTGDDTEAARTRRRTVKSDDWPFRVELLPIDALMVDHDYQRPVPWPFVRKLAASFDERLVGTIDVAERRRGAIFAILDGQLRYESMRLIQKETVWASIYSGLDKQAEARFFLHKNQDRKAIHPFYTYKARLTAGDPETQAITEIVESFGYRVSIVSAAHDQRNISAIAALESAYRRSNGAGEALTPTLKLLKASTFGRKSGQHTTLLRGLGRFFEQYSTYDWDRLVALVSDRGPEWLIGRAREEQYTSTSSYETNLVRVLVTEYNRGLPTREKLSQPVFA